jgi:hypothetical protein
MEGGSTAMVGVQRRSEFPTQVFPFSAVILTWNHPFVLAIILCNAVMRSTGQKTPT